MASDSEYLSTSAASPLYLVNSPAQWPQGYFRSKLFIAPCTANTLVAAASPIISLLERMNMSTSLPPIQIFRDNLDHELKAFASRIYTAPERQELNTIAYYLLCATVDELVGKNYLRVDDKTSEFCAFTPPSPIGAPGPEEHFFNIVNYIKTKPEQYFELIELAYHCLITGFEGMHHAQSGGRMALDNLIEELFQVIQSHRTGKPKRLFKNLEGQNQIKTHHSSKMFLSICVGMGVMILSSFFLSYWLLESKAKAVQFGHEIIASLED